mmetsp:Transcript_34241/g.44145  ORF Transcript_34241/g.44145 Transcript_34241/m.44145 type:complete len:306 (-) Transcript_34241:121-1038(-)
MGHSQSFGHNIVGGHSAFHGWQVQRMPGTDPASEVAADAQKLGRRRLGNHETPAVRGHIERMDLELLEPFARSALLPALATSPLSAASMVVPARPRMLECGIVGGPCGGFDAEDGRGRLRVEGVRSSIERWREDNVVSFATISGPVKFAANGNSLHPLQEGIAWGDCRRRRYHCRPGDIFRLVDGVHLGRCHRTIFGSGRSFHCRLYRCLPLQPKHPRNPPLSHAGIHAPPRAQTGRVVVVRQEAVVAFVVQGRSLVGVLRKIGVGSETAVERIAAAIVDMVREADGGDGELAFHGIRDGEVFVI